MRGEEIVSMRAAHLPLAGGNREYNGVYVPEELWPSLMNVEFSEEEMARLRECMVKETADIGDATDLDKIDEMVADVYKPSVEIEKFERGLELEMERRL